MTDLSVKKLFKNDYLVMLAVACSTVPGLLYFIGSRFGFMFGRRGVMEVSATELRGWPFWIAVIAGVSVVLLISRVVWIKGILENGSTIGGRIDKVWHHRDRGRIEYEYTSKAKLIDLGLPSASRPTIATSRTATPSKSSSIGTTHSVRS